MGYSSFTLEKVKKQFNLYEENITLFDNINTQPVSAWLDNFLGIGIPLALSSGTEKAKSEFIIAPILFELNQRNIDHFMIYSGKNFDVDFEQGLNGECDFMLSKGKMTRTIESPIVALIEAKDHDIDKYLGQCVAQMVAAQLFNAQEGLTIDTIFGCVTTGETWQFLKLIEKNLLIDKNRYYINNIALLFGVLQKILDIYL
ncbi:MAG: hypothetical protein B6242_14065 [Anaerolineaceae bacterium 4572_78]|nr:MAG: hypothetical protein B6242_14065 [Anaerolineaceae bacterium 4572_78]